MDVREVTADECERAGAVVLAAYAALPGAHLDPDYALELTAVDRRAEEAVVLVAVDRDEGRGVVGCVTYVPGPESPWAELLEPGEAGIRMLAVDPSVQGRGVGAALVDACIERARGEGKRALFLHTTPWMRAAHRLYERAGFTRLPERDWVPLPEVPLLGYVLPLR